MSATHEIHATEGFIEETVVVAATGLRAHLLAVAKAGGRVVSSAPVTLHGVPAYALTARY